jgi:hypothetical protein
MPFVFLCLSLDSDHETTRLRYQEGGPEMSLVFVSNSPMLTNRALAKALLAWLKAWCFSISTASLYFTTIAAAALSAWAVYSILVKPFILDMFSKTDDFFPKTGHTTQFD